MNTNQSDTPRTDDAQWGTGKATVDFARTLERELTQACAENGTLRGAAMYWKDEWNKQTKERDDLKADNAALRAEIERWRDSNNRLRSEMEAQSLRANTAEVDAERLRDDLQIALAEVQKAKSSHRIECEENERLRADNERLKKALASSCDDEREMAISEGPGHSTCGLADELTRRAEKAEADNERLLLQNECFKNEVARWTKWHSEQSWNAEIVGYKSQLTKMDEDNARLREVLEDIGRYRGEGSLTAPWREIVRSIGEQARAALAEGGKKP